MKQTKERFCGVVGILVSCLILFAKWIRFKEAGHTILGFYFKVHHYGGITAFSKAFEDMEEVTATGVSIVPAYIFLFLPLLLAVVLLIRSALLFSGRDFGVLTNIAYWIGLIYLLTVFLTPYFICPALFICIFFMLADYIGARLIMERDEMNRKARELKQKEKEERLDKIRRMRFPGRYSRDFFAVVFANFRSNLKGYFLFITAASMSAALLYILFGTQYVIYKSNTDQNLMVLGEGSKIFSEVLKIVIFVSVMLLVLIISNYIKMRMRNYGIFLSLGIRKKTLWLIISLEYIFCILISLTIGLLLGNFGLRLMKYVYLQRIGIQDSIHTSYGIINLVAVIAFLLITGLATLINYHLFEGIDITSSAVNAAKKEGLPKRYLLLGAIYGFYCIISGIRGFRYGYWMEEPSRIAVMLLGFLLLIYCGGTKIIIWFMKEKERYLKRVFQILPWKYRFKTNAKYFFLLFTIQILILSVYLPRLSSCLTANFEEADYPYDFVCMAHEDDTGFFQNLEKFHGVQMDIYPMIRVDTLLSEPFSFNTLASSTTGGMFFPLGQHIGISETTYQKLKAVAAPDDKSTPHLKDKEIHVVFQQDASERARLLDWYFSPVERLGYDPHLRSGSIRYYDLQNRDELYPSYQIKSQEKLVLTGMFHSGDQENIVVFSDVYFEQQQKLVLDRLDKEPSPTQLVTIRTSKSMYPEIADKLGDFTKKNVSDSAWDASILPCYEKQVRQHLAEGERFFKEIAFSAVILSLLICSLFIFYLKYSLEISELRRRDEMLDAIGMKRKDRLRLLHQELSAHSWWTLLSATAVSAIFFIGLPVMRMFSSRESGIYYMILLMILTGYIFIYAIGIHLLEKHIIKMIQT